MLCSSGRVLVGDPPLGVELDWVGRKLDKKTQEALGLRQVLRAETFFAKKRSEMNTGCLSESLTSWSMMYGAGTRKTPRDVATGYIHWLPNSLGKKCNSSTCFTSYVLKAVRLL